MYAVLLNFLNLVLLIYRFKLVIVQLSVFVALTCFQVTSQSQRSVTVSDRHAHKPATHLTIPGLGLMDRLNAGEADFQRKSGLML